MAARGVNTPGVKKLLEAEARAAETVKKARNRMLLYMLLDLIAREGAAPQAGS